MTNGQRTGILSPLSNALQGAIPTSARGRSIGHEQQDAVWHTERASMSNQQDPDTRKNRHKQREQHESSLSALLGTEPAQRQALAAQFVQQWREAGRATRCAAALSEGHPGLCSDVSGQSESSSGLTRTGPGVSPAGHGASRRAG